METPRGEATAQLDIRVWAAAGEGAVCQIHTILSPSGGKLDQRRAREIEIDDLIGHECASQSPVSDLLWRRAGLDPPTGPVKVEYQQPCGNGRVADVRVTTQDGCQLLIEDKAGGGSFQRGQGENYQRITTASVRTVLMWPRPRSSPVARRSWSSTLLPRSKRRGLGGRASTERGAVQIARTMNWTCTYPSQTAEQPARRGLTERGRPHACARGRRREVPPNAGRTDDDASSHAGAPGVSVRIFGSLRPLRTDQGLPYSLVVGVPEAGTTARALATPRTSSREDRGRVRQPCRPRIGVHVSQGDRVAFVPYGTPGPHRVLLGLHSAGDGGSPSTPQGSSG